MEKKSPLTAPPFQRQKNCLFLKVSAVTTKHDVLTPGVNKKAVQKEAVP